MIYFDNAATTLKKPPGVADAVKDAIESLGNAGRSFHSAAQQASREVYLARAEIARLVGLQDPLNVAFTSSATESLNLVIAGLMSEHDHAITTVAEHNSALRPLYLRGCELSFLSCDSSGVLEIDSLEKLITPRTRLFVCTHGSNVTGNITDVRALYQICRARGVLMVLDAAQTLGAIPVSYDMADILCFTGHKALFGPQGTGGVIVNGDINFKIAKTGGAGINSFDRVHSTEMPDIFEAGTLNAHGICGLRHGVQFINEAGIDAICAKEAHLARRFVRGVQEEIASVKLYGDFHTETRLPVVALNLHDMDSAELTERLWTGYEIATRPGAHCAPLLHERMGTRERGMVRFSFSYFNTEDEIDAGIQALSEIAHASR